MPGRKSLLCVALLLAVAASSNARPDRPFTPDSTTAGLWSLDCQYTERAEQRFYLTDSITWFTKAFRSADGNYLVIGGWRIEDFHDGTILSKLNEDGDALWTKAYDLNVGWNSTQYGLVETADGDIWMVGTTQLEDRTEAMFLFRTDSSGDSLALRLFPSEAEGGSTYGMAIMLDSDENILLGGFIRFDEFGIDGWNILVMKIDREGEVVWNVNYPKEDGELAGLGVEEIIETADGEYLCAGVCETWPHAWAYDAAYAVWLSSDGEWLRERRFEDEEKPSWIFDLVTTSNGYLMVGGIQHAWDGFVDGWDSRVLVTEFDDEGDVLWSHSYGDEVFEDFIRSEGRSVTIPPGSGVILIAATNAAINLEQEPFPVFDSCRSSVLTLNNHGEYLHHYTFSTETDDHVNSIFHDSDGSLVMFGVREMDEDNQNGGPYFARTNQVAFPSADKSNKENYLLTTVESVFIDGLFGEALQLSPGSAVPIYAEDSPSLRPLDFTLEGWIKMNPDTGHTGAVITKVFTRELNSFCLLADNREGQIEFKVNTLEDEWSVRQNAQPDDGEWHYFEASLGQDTLALAWDDEPLAIEFYDGEIIYEIGPLVFGSDRVEPGSRFQYYGLLDEIRLSGYRYFEDETVVKPGLPIILYPSSLILSAFPNPFNSSTTITYTLPRPGRYAVDVVDISGRVVARLSHGWREAGSYREVWNAGGLTSGEFFVILNGANRTAQSVTLVR